MRSIVCVSSSGNDVYMCSVNMKVYAFLAVLFCARAVIGMFSSSIDIDLHQNEEDCARRSGASYDSINQARKMRMIPDTPVMNAFSKCMLGKYNVMNDSGLINSDVRSYTIITDTDSVFRVSERCIRLSGRDADDTARRIMNCYLEGNQIVMALTPLGTNPSGY